MTFATSAGYAGGTGRGFARLVPIALLAALALVASLAVSAGSASAAVAEPKVTFLKSEAEFTTAHFEFKTESPEFGLVYMVQYTTNLGIDVKDEEWIIGNGQIFEQPFVTYVETGTQTITEDVTGLKPGTKYQFRFTVLMYDGNEYPSFRYPATPEPGPFFETKFVAKPSVHLDPVTDITRDTAHFSGTVQPNAPAGPLSPTQKAAYDTTWNVVCRPTCPTVEAPSVVEGDAASGAVSLDPIRLETNTYYEVDLVAKNAAGEDRETVIFETPFILPGVKAIPGGSAGKGSFNIGGLVTPYNSKISDCHFEYGPTTEYVYKAPCSPNPVGRNMVQSLSLGTNGEVDDPNFRIAFRGQTTQSMPVGAPASLVKQELESLSAIGPQGISKLKLEFGFFTAVYEIEFGGPLASRNIGPLRALQKGETIDSPGGNFAGTLVQGGNNSPVLVEAHLTGLTPGATYHYELYATNSLGTVASGDQTFVPPQAADEANCPNEEIRVENSSTALPECRAYELVTSAFKASSDASLFAFSEAETVGYETKAPNVANSGQGHIVNNYVAYRTESGWKTQEDLNGPLGSLFAPPNSFEGIPIPAAYSADLKSALYYVPVKYHKTIVEVYYRGEDGTFARVGDGNPSTGFIALSGTSDDLFRTIWNGSTGAGTYLGPGLYEFEGTGNGPPTRRLDVDNAGDPISECNGNANQAGAVHGDAVTANANIVYFTVTGCEFDSPLGPLKNEIWVRVNRTTSYDASETHCTRIASDPGGACNAPADPTFDGATNDGSRAYFSTTQQLVNGDTNQTRDLYTYSLPIPSNPVPDPSLIQVSGTAKEAKVQSVIRVGKVGDVSRVYFTAEGVLADNHDAYDQPAVAGDQNLYVWQQDASHPEGETKFIARLQNSLYFSGSSADGRYLVFTAFAPMVPTDTDNALDVYRYDAVTGELTRVSVDASGVGGNTDGLHAEIYVRPISNDGQEVVFYTSEALSANDGNGAADIYIWRNGHTSLISTGSVGGGADRPLIDASGKNIYFTSRQALTADDIDNVVDVYSAHVNGGFSFGDRAPCSGEACQPSRTSGPTVPAAATKAAKGSGNHRRGTVSILPLSSSERAKLGVGGRVTLGLKVSGPGKISVLGMARVGGRQRQVLEVKSIAVQAGEVRLPVSLDESARVALQKGGSLKVRLTASFADAVPSASTVTLTSPRSRAGHSRKKRGG